MRWRHFSCALLFLFGSIGLSRADVTYSYVASVSAGAPVTSVNSDNPASSLSVTGLTPGNTVSLNIYLVETVTTTSSLSGNATSSLINNYWLGGNHKAGTAFFGLASAGFALAQTGPAVGGSASTIPGGPVFLPGGGAQTAGYTGVNNQAGFVFGPGFTYSFTDANTGNPTTGGSVESVIYANLPTTTPGAVSGNNLQVVATLATTASNSGATLQQGVLTDNNTFNAATNSVGSGKILIGTETITVGSGTTVFSLTPLASSPTLIGTANTFFNGATNITTVTQGATPMTGQKTITTTDAPNGTTTVTVETNAGAIISGPTTTNNGPTPSGSNGSTTATFLSNNLESNKTSGVVLLDVPYNAQSAQRTSNATSQSFDSFINMSQVNAGGGFSNAVAGPDSPSGANALIPYFGSNSNAFTITLVPAAVPEPSSMALCGLLSIGGAWYAARRRKAAATV